MLEDQPTRPCSTCGQDKQQSEFSFKQKQGIFHTSCKACHAAYSREWKRSNPDKAAAAVRDWQSRNKDRIKQSKRQHYISNLRDYAIKRKKYYAEHSEKAKSYTNDWNQANPAKRRAAAKQWLIANRATHQAHGLARKSRKAGGRFTSADIADLLIRQAAKCSACSRSLMSGYHIDHVMPLAKGGSNTRDNLQLLCPPCNLRKGAKDPYIWAMENGRLFT